MVYSNTLNKERKETELAELQKHIATCCNRSMFHLQDFRTESLSCLAQHDFFLAQSLLGFLEKLLQRQKETYYFCSRRRLPILWVVACLDQWFFLAEHILANLDSGFPTPICLTSIKSLKSLAFPSVASLSQLPCICPWRASLHEVYSLVQLLTSSSKKRFTTTSHHQFFKNL